MFFKICVTDTSGNYYNFTEDSFDEIKLSVSAIGVGFIGRLPKNTDMSTIPNEIQSIAIDAIDINLQNTYFKTMINDNCWYIAAIN